MKNDILNKLLSLGVQLKIIDGNLKVNAPKGVLTKELLEEIKEYKAYLISLISFNTSIPKTEIKENYALTPTQYFMWFTHEHLGGKRAYNITSTLKLKGKLNEFLLEKAFQKVITRHESLRTVFKKDENDQVQQHILTSDEVHFKLQKAALQHFSVEQLHNRIKLEYLNTFDLEKGPLLNGTLLKTSEEEHILVFVLHHIIGDGWSLQLLTREIMLVYNSLASAEEVQLQELPIQYKDYSEWLNKKLISDEYNQKLEFWKEQFRTKSPALELIMNKRPAVKTYNGRIYNHEFSKQFLGELNAFAKEQQMTLFMLLMGSLNGLFSKYTGQTDITLGTTAAGREHTDLEHQIGLYSNALAIRTKFHKEDSFLELMQKQKNTLIKAYENKEYPFTALVNHLKPAKDQSRSALFDIMVLLQNHQGLEINDQKGINGVTASEYNEIERGVSQLDISFVFVEKEHGLSLSVEYNTDIYNQDFITALLSHFEEFVKSGLQNPNQSINDVEIVTAAEKNKILTEFNQDNVSSEVSLTVIDLIKSAAAENPNKTALVYQEEEISYRTLDIYSSKLANYLQQNRNVKKGDFVGIGLQRNSWSIITILAVLKTGAVYVPIDPDYPEDRRNYIEKDSGCKFTITAAVLEEFKNISDRFIGEYNAEVSPGDLAYIIYTSGSTGNPKGVQITHTSLTDYAVTFKNYFQLTSHDSIVQQASISFDTSIEEIFPILVSGGSMVIYDGKGDFETLFRLCEKHNVTVLSTNPYALQYLNAAYDQFDLQIRILISGGDVLQPDYIHNLWNHISVYNTYGPTESTVCATYYHVNEKLNAVSIGKPIANRQVYIIEPESSQLAPVGIIGELCISGKGLSAGYLNQPELTAEKFVQNPFIKGERMYRTGDLAYWLADGNIEYIGRIDSQVKIRGFRIELGEIETSLLQYSQNVRQAVAAVKEINGEKVLAAYYVSTQEIDKSEIRSYLQGKLPEYMVPGFYIALDVLPLTPNGKTDRKALPEISGEDLIRKEYAAPRNAAEQNLAQIWQEVLGVDQVGITDNFFELGGHSLVAAQVINRIQKQLNKKVSFKDFFSNPTIEALSARLSDAGYVSITPAPIQESYPLTASQNRLWLLSQLDGGSLAYNIPFAFELSGALDKDNFQASLKKVIERHEILRTYFKSDESGVVRQHILQADLVNFKLIEEDFTQIDNQQKSVSNYLQKQNHIAFDLEKAPLLRAGLVKLEEQKHIFFLTMHHIIGDGWSLELLISEVVKIYNALNEGKDADLPVLNIQYKDYAVWLSNELEQEKHLVSKEFWMKQFTGEIPVLDLPSFNKRPLSQSYKGDSVSHTFSQTFLYKLKSYSKTQDATLFMTLMAGVKTLLYRYTGQNDLVIGTPIAGREHPDLENQAGLYLNTLAIRTQLKEKSHFTSILNQEKETLLEAYQHQNYPFDELIGNLNLKRDMSRSALFDVMVVLQNQSQLQNLSSGDALTGLQIKNYEFKNNTSQFDVSFVFVEKEEGLSLTIQYNTDLYDSLLIKRISAHLENLMTQALENPSLAVEELSYITPDEKIQVTETFNATAAEYSRDKTIIDKFEEQVLKTPEQTAVVFEETELSYQSLNALSNQLGGYLRKHYDIQPDDLIGIKLERSERMMVAVLGILKSGGAYVPIDLAYPQSRIEYIEKDSSSKLIIDEKVLEAFYKEKDEYSTLNIVKNNTPSNLAYVIYTSGTTGNPKGVMVENRNAATLIDWSKEEYANSVFDIVYAVTSYCFDLSVYEFFFTLTTGKTLRVLKNALDIETYINNDKNVLLNTVPSVVRKLLEDKVSLKNINVLNMAGEILPTDIIDKLPLEIMEVRNLYGPSEDTTYSTSYLITSKGNRTISVGRPISNTQAWILNESLLPVPVGIAGKLYLSGEGVTRGYLNKPELTAEKFVNNPFVQGAVMYDTGDLAYWLPDGNIEFLGRKDHQVKIRGFRIELGEIETAVSIYSSTVKQVVVDTKEIESTQVLAAYYTASENVNKGELRKHLQSVLPEFMVPGYFIQLENMPLTPNGKIDRKALPEVSEKHIIKKEYVAPKTKIEKSLVTIWQEVLKVDRIGITDNFFELGGHSLMAGQLINRVNKQFDVSINIKEIFMSPTIEILALNIENTKWIEETVLEDSTAKILI
jgi:amino acid adenylation domain-containing protein